MFLFVLCVCNKTHFDLMKTSMIIIIFILSLVILSFIYLMIYINRESTNTLSLTIKVFMPLLVSFSILIWELISTKVEDELNFTSIAVFDLNDGFPINLGGVYFNTHNKGVAYSAFTTAYRATNFQEVLMSKKIFEFDLDELRKLDKSPPLSLNVASRKSELGEVSTELVAISILHNFLKRRYNHQWEIKYLDSTMPFGGGGMGIIEEQQFDKETNSSFYKIAPSLENFKITLTEDLKGSGFYIPKTGEIKVTRGKDVQFSKILISYTSKYIKNYDIKIRLIKHSDLRKGKFVDALKKQIDTKDLHAYYYTFDLKYSANWWNKHSPQAKREIKWINQQFNEFEKYFSFKLIESDLIYALNNFNPETTDLRLNGR